jgi:hypothetical protein
VNHAGARLLSDVADEIGLTSGLSAAMAPTKQRRGGHDRGEVLRDLAVLRNQPGLFSYTPRSRFRTEPFMAGKLRANRRG